MVFTGHLPPVRHVTTAAAVKLFRNALVTSRAQILIVIFDLGFGVRNCPHIAAPQDCAFRESAARMRHNPTRKLGLFKCRFFGAKGSFTIFPMASCPWHLVKENIEQAGCHMRQSIESAV